MERLDKSDFGYYEYYVGRYTKDRYLGSEKDFKPYEHEKDKLVWNVIEYDFNAKKIKVINLFEYNWVFLRDGLLYAKSHYANDFTKFAECVRDELQCEYWSRSEYEIIVSGWPGTGVKEEDLENIQKEIAEQKQKGYKNCAAQFYDDTCKKIDVYTQIMINWDRFIEYVWENKKLITKKKLGL